MHVVYIPMVLPVCPAKTPQVMQESELLNTSKGKITVRSGSLRRKKKS